MPGAWRRGESDRSGIRLGDQDVWPGRSLLENRLREVGRALAAHAGAQLWLEGVHQPPEETTGAIHAREQADDSTRNHEVLSPPDAPVQRRRASAVRCNGC